MRFIRFQALALLVFAPVCLCAQTLAELSSGQNALIGTSAWQKHADLQAYEDAARQNSLPVLTPLATPQGPAALSVTRLPDVKLNENMIRKTVLVYNSSHALAAAAKTLVEGNKAAALKAYDNIITAAADNREAAQAAADDAIIRLVEADYKEAIKYINRAIELDGHNPFCTLVKIWILAAQNDIKKAEKEYKNLLYLTADFEYISSAKLALAQANSLDTKTKAAMPLLQNLYSGNPYVISHAVYLMGRLAYGRKDYKTALELFEQSLNHDNNNYMAQKYFSKTQERLKMFVPAWQNYASLFILDTQDGFLEKKLDKLSKYLKAAPADYLFYTRLNELFVKKPQDPQGPHVRVGLFAKYNGDLAVIESFSLIPGAAFSIKDEKLGTVISGDAFTPKTVVFDREKQSAHIQNKWNAAEFSTKRPFVIDLDKNGYTILIKDIKAQDIFAANTGDKELKGSIMVIPGETGMNLINYTSLEDILPAVLMSVTRGIKEPAALEAAAVALRTFIKGGIEKAASSQYDLPDNTPLFRYGGINMEAEYAKQAAENTAGLKLAWKQGGFHALAAPGIYRSCSVVTEDGVRNAPDAPPYTFTPSNLFKYMFSNPPKDLVSAPRDPTLWSSVKWLYSFPLKDIEARLKQNHNIGKLKSIEAAKRTPHGRAQTLKFTGSRAVLELPFEEANFIIAAGTLRSPFFQIIPFTQKGEILFIGTDTGAGKGLCLEGAAGMARAENKTARQILKYYYPDLEPLEEWIEPKSL